MQTSRVSHHHQVATSGLGFLMSPERSGNSFAVLSLFMYHVSRERACLLSTKEARRSSLRCCADACSCSLAISEANNESYTFPNPRPAVQPRLMLHCAPMFHREPVTDMDVDVIGIEYIDRQLHVDLNRF